MANAELFWAKVRISEDPDECQEWQGGFNAEKYPVVTWNGVSCMAHRVAYELGIGPIPNSGFIRRTCGNRNCVNPKHLTLAPGGLPKGQEELENRAVVRFWRCVDKSDNEKGCWIWKGYKTNGGYGLLHIGTRNIAAHRYSYELNVGPLEPGKVICHKCDVPLCVNPEHLFQGTQRENIVDMHRKGRNCKKKEVTWQSVIPEYVTKGQDHHRALLTNEEAKLARVMFATGATQLEIAGELRVDNTTISNIVKNKTYNTPSAQPEELHKIVFRGKSSVLSEEDQENLVSQYRNGERRSELAKIFNLSFPSVCRIITKITGEQPKKRIGEETVLAIQAMKKAGRPLKEIAATHKVSLTTASNICTGNAWSGVLNASDPTESLRTLPCSTA